MDAPPETPQPDEERELTAQLQGSASVAKLRQEIISQLEGVHDTSLLMRVKENLSHLISTDRLTEYDLVLAGLLEPEERGDFSTDEEPPWGTPLRRFERKSAPFFFGLTTAYLIVFGLFLIIFPEPGLESLGLTFGQILLALHSVFALELVAVFWLTSRHEEKPRPGFLQRRALVALFPIARFGVRHSHDADLIWFPFWGWCRVNRSLFETLKRRFSTPMILVAVLILPILVVEWKLQANAEALLGPENLLITMRCVEAFIWAAFAFEFALVFSVAPQRLEYCKESWLDILIILLPLISFMRALRVLRAARLQSLGRGFRLRGLITKARQALIMAEFIQRLLFPNPKRHIASLRKKFKKNLRERQELERLALMAVDRMKAKREKEREHDSNNETE